MAHIIRLSLVPALAAATLLAGCAGSDITRSFGLTRDSPDEFTVTTRAPLSMPPDFQLRPPRPGAQRPQEQSTRSAAEAALVPQTALDSDQASASPGQSALVSAAGPAAPANIRSQINQEASLEAGNQGLTDKLMFWRKKPDPGVLVDPQKETQRLRENAALGQNPEQGDTPIIQPQKKGLLGTLF